MQYAMLIGPLQDNIWMDQSASLKTWVSIAATILLMFPPHLQMGKNDDNVHFVMI